MENLLSVLISGFDINASHINIKNVSDIWSSCEKSLQIHLLPLYCLVCSEINMTNRIVGKL